MDTVLPEADRVQVQEPFMWVTTHIMGILIPDSRIFPWTLLVQEVNCLFCRSIPLQGDGGFGSVRLSVSKSSRIGTLKLMENAQAVLTLSTVCRMANMELAAGSSLTIQAGSYSFTVTGSTTGSGSIALFGSSLVFHDLDAGSITLDNAVMDASGCKVAATDHLTVNSSTVQNASLLGFEEDVAGEKTVSFTGNGNELHNIEELLVQPKMELPMCPSQVQKPFPMLLILILSVIMELLIYMMGLSLQRKTHGRVPIV